jgi:glucokinase
MNSEQESRADGVRIGIDIGGTGTRFVALDSTSGIVSELVTATPAHFGSGSAETFLADRIRELAQGAPIAAIGIGASGPVDPDGIIRNPDTLPSFTGRPIVEALKEQFAVPVSIDNDAVCAALAEQRAGAAKGSPSLLHITLGTGIGACMLVNGAPLRGGDGMHPETGHISVSTPSTPCYCGRTSCWEQAASRQTLQRTAATLLGSEPSDKGAIPELAARARSGQPSATATFRDYGRAVADGLGTLLAVYRPQSVVLGGSAAEYFELYREPLEDSLAELGSWIHYSTLTKTALNDYGGAVGAAFLVV